MTIALYITTGILVVTLLFCAKMLNDKNTALVDSSRQFNELRASYQKMEYSLTTAQARINNLNSTNKTLQDELDALMANPMVNTSKLATRIKK